MTYPCFIQLYLWLLWHRVDVDDLNCLYDDLKIVKTWRDTVWDRNCQPASSTELHSAPPEGAREYRPSWPSLPRLMMISFVRFISSPNSLNTSRICGVSSSKICREKNKFCDRTFWRSFRSSWQSSRRIPCHRQWNEWQYPTHQDIFSTHTMAMVLCDIRRPFWRSYN